MRDVLLLLRRRPRFRRLWLASVISLGGDWLSYVALSVLALDQGSGALAVALVLVAHNLPTAVLAPLAGPLADRLDRRTLMIASNAAQAVLTLGMAGAALEGAMALVQILLVLRFAAAAFFPPAESAALPDTVEPSELRLANTLNGATWSAVFAIGVAAGGVLVAAVGAVVALVLDAASFLAANLVLARVGALPPPAPSAAPAAPPRAELPSLGEAWRHALARPRVFSAMLAKTPLAIAAGGAWVLLVERSSALELAGTGAVTLGLLHFARAIGTGAGPLMLPWLGRFGETVDARLAWCAAAAFGGVAMFLLVDGPLWVVASMLLWGIGSGANWVESSASLQKEAPGALLGRLSALDLLAMSFAVSASALVAALLTDAGAAPNVGAWLVLGLGVGSWAALGRLARSAEPPPVAELAP